MSDWKPCTRCRRSIDAGARLCPFCAHDQTVPYAPPAPAVPANAAVPAPVAPAAQAAFPVRAERWSTQTLVIGAIGVIFIAVFAIGALVNGFTSSRARKDVARIQSDNPAAPPENPVGDFDLIPVTDSIGTAMTSPPVVDPDHQFQAGYQPGDATAMTAQQYSKINQPAPVPTTASAGQIDPRSIQAPAIPKALPPMPAPPREPIEREEPAPERSVERTEARPLSQPLPDVDLGRLKHDVTMRFRLTVGSNGRVTEIDVVKGGEGLTAQMIAAIQRWKFKPATEDGRPVSSVFPVEISFNAQ